MVTTDLLEIHMQKKNKRIEELESEVKRLKNENETLKIQYSNKNEDEW